MGSALASQVPPLSTAAGFLDMEKTLSDLIAERCALGRAGLGQGIQSFAELLISAAGGFVFASCELQQRLDLDRKRLGVAGIEAMQPLRELLAVEFVAHRPLDLSELVGTVERTQLGVHNDQPRMGFFVFERLADQTADV